MSNFPDTPDKNTPCQVTLRFYAELNDFLPADKRQQDWLIDLDRRTSIKDLVESLGVPHTEVDLLVANGDIIDFSYVPKCGDRISVYPEFRSLSLGHHLKPDLDPNPKFVLDAHLGKLAGYLRMLGFDTIYDPDSSDLDLAFASKADGRILLTRDIGLLKRKIVFRGYYVRETEPKRQIIEVIKQFKLLDKINPFGRCAHCNDLLIDVPKGEIIHLLLPKTILYYDEFRRCRGCGKIYWKGSHHEAILRLIEFIQEEVSLEPKRLQTS